MHSAGQMLRVKGRFGPNIQQHNLWKNHDGSMGLVDGGTYIYHTHQLNVGKYTIRGSYGNVCALWIRKLEKMCHPENERRDHFKRKWVIFQPSNFPRDMLVSGGIGRNVPSKSGGTGARWPELFINENMWNLQSLAGKNNTRRFCAKKNPKQQTLMTPPKAKAIPDSP